MGPLQGDEASARTAGPVVSRTREIDAVPARAFLRAFDGPRAFWSGPDGPTVATAGAVVRATASGPDRFAAIRETAASLFDDVDADGPRAARPRLFGGFAFHDDHRASSPWTEFPPAQFLLPALQLTRADGTTYLTAHGTAADPATLDEHVAEAAAKLSDVPAPGSPGDPPGVVGKSLTTPRGEWVEQVAAAVERIRGGDLRKVALAGALRATLGRPASVPAVLGRLASAYPDCYRFAVAPEGGTTFLGATPERLVSLRGRSVRTGALAGTVGRGETAAEDERLADALRNSDKDREEHDLVVEAIRDQLAPVVESLSAGDRRVRKLATVQHLYTPVEASLSGDGHVLSLVERLHPTPAVGGLPPEAALAAIRDIETLSADDEAGRGWYAAPVGWFDAAGDGTFAVAIRSAVTAGREATLFAGNGIVADSDPDREWDEVISKYRPVLDALE